jgi:putative membrane protein
MTRVRRWLLLAGAMLFIGLLTWQGLPVVLSTLSAAGAGLLLVAAFHLLPLVLDAAALRILLERGSPGSSWRDTILTRWVGETVNSLMPGGQLGGPVIMVRQLTQRGMPMPQAAAAVTVSTTFQMLGQILFAITGVALIGAHISEALLISIAVMAAMLVGFYVLQRRGLFRSLVQPAMRWFSPARIAVFSAQADAVDRAVQQTYGLRVRSPGSFALNLIGWFVGTGEVYLILRQINSPVSWKHALLLESLGQAIKGAGFAIPGALGVQEGGFLLLAPLAGLSAGTALALSLAKRARELLLGAPGLLYLHFFERRAALPATPDSPIL